jgi:hypothetical protein
MKAFAGESPMLYFSLGLSAISLGCLFLFNRVKSDGVYRPVIVGLVCAIGPMCVFPAVFPGFLVSLFVGLIAVVIWKRDWLPRYAAVPLVLVSIVLGHLVPYMLVVRSDMRRYDEIREATVQLNADERLRRPAKPAIDAEPISDGLDELEESAIYHWKKNGREFHFSRLHKSQIDQFVNHPGFGVVRMLHPVREKDFYLPHREPIPQPVRLATSQDRFAFEHPIPTPKVVEKLTHRKTVAEFAFPFGWGWERSPNEHLGFQSHQLGKRSRFESEMFGIWSLELDDGWRIASLELIGLLAHPKQTVYMTANLPRMDEAKTAPTRDPDEFESAGLKAIAKGQELYFGKSRTEPLLRMVGGIRAAKSCTGCHGCREGELLGAFSYTLVK